MQLRAPADVTASRHGGVRHQPNESERNARGPPPPWERGRSCATRASAQTPPRTGPPARGSRECEGDGRLLLNRFLSCPNFLQRAYFHNKEKRGCVLRAEARGAACRRTVFVCAMSRARGASFRCPEPQATRQGLRGRGAEPALRTAALGPAGLDSAAPRPLGGLHAAREVGTLAADRGRKTRSQAGLAVQPTAARPQRTPAAHVPPTPGPARRSSSQGLLPKAQLSAHTHDQNEPSLLPVASPPPASSGSQLPGWDSPVSSQR